MSFNIKTYCKDRKKNTNNKFIYSNLQENEQKTLACSPKNAYLCICKENEMTIYCRFHETGSHIYIDMPKSECRTLLTINLR